MSAAPCLSCLVSADLSHQIVSVASVILFIAWWPLFCLVSVHQDVSAVSGLFCLLPADPSFCCLCSPGSGCECCPLFVLFAACWLLFFSISVYQIVSAASCLSFLLLVNPSFSQFLLTRRWMLSLACPVCCLLTFSFSLSLIISVWVLSLACPVCYLLTSLFLYLYSLACECCPLLVLFPVCWPLFFSISAHQVVSAAPCLSYYPMLFWYCFLSLSTYNIQNQIVAFFKKFVKMVGLPFVSLIVFKPFQNKFSLHIHDIHHIMIGTLFYSSSGLFSYIFTAVTLILEYATILLSSGSTWKSALHQAQLQYIQFGLSSAATQFHAAFFNYSNAEFIQFILNNRLLAEQVPFLM